MSLYGYKRRTTPFLDSYNEGSRVLVKQGVSAAVSTDIALPSFFGMVYRPDGSLQIKQKTRNLFRLAKENNFTTYYASAQGEEQLANVKKEIGVQYIDKFDDADTLGFSSENLPYDSVLVKYLQNFNVTSPFFLVLHQRGSHFPYSKRYPKSFAKYPVESGLSDKEIKTNEYDDSVRYTDQVLRQIIMNAKHKFKRPTYIIFTSDHGESLGEEGVYGHGNLNVRQQYQVPIVIVALNGASLPKLDQNQKVMSHYELSVLIAGLLG